jgi:hypothetical protein
MPRLVHIRPLDPDVPHHPAVIQQFNRRAADAQLRVADRITAFAGSMAFVYLHVALFGAWMLFIEANPWPQGSAQRRSLSRRTAPAART